MRQHLWGILIQHLHAIAARLNAEGIPSPRGGLWNASTINGSRQRRNGILNNELYLGRITYNRQRFVKDPDTGKRVSRPNPPEVWITHDVPHLRIIDQQTWDAVQAIKARYSSHAGNIRQTKKRLLSGLIRCGSCGGAMTIVNRERYSCSARRERGTCDSPTSIAAVDLENRVLDGLRSILLGREELIAEFADVFKAELNRLQKTRHTRERAHAKELTKIENGIRRCLDYIVEGDGDPGAVRHTLQGLEAHKEAILRDMKAANDIAEVVIHPNIADLYRRKVENLQTLLTDETSRHQAMEIIRSLIDRIEISPGAKRGHAEVLLVGALASILDYASSPTAQTQNAASGGGGVCRVLLVAGA
ncbi:MAG: recombinase family protein [Alphaproteobacteria bacterium]|nr:recombinase family protein [Alphaproteobacteria bacterium]